MQLAQSLLAINSWGGAGLGVVLGLVVFMLLYNGHVSRRNAVEYAFSCIDVQLKKRWDLIPQLVEMVKGYATHEKETLMRVMEARRLASAHIGERGKQFQYEEQIQRELPAIMAVAESYPELKADEQFLWLQRNLTEVESQISAARRAYNAAVTSYNNGVEMFPQSVVAMMFRFRKCEWFSINEEERGTLGV